MVNALAAAVEPLQQLRVRLTKFSARAPNAARPHGTLRVMIESSPALATLNDTVRAALGEDEQAFSGHITLARLGEGVPVPEGYTELRGCACTPRTVWATRFI